MKLYHILLLFEATHILAYFQKGKYMKIGIIGAGKVGFSIGKYLTEHKKNVVGYYSRTRESAMMAAEFTGTCVFESIEQLVQECEVLFIAVPDGTISTIWDKLNQYSLQNKKICHFSGAFSSQIFSNIKQYSAYGYSIHPLFAFADRYRSYLGLTEAVFSIEGAIEYLDEMKTVFQSMGNTVITVSTEDKVKYHAACASASNLVLGLFEYSESLLESCGFTKESAHRALIPLIKGNVDSYCLLGAEGALTGPIERNDTETVAKHMASLTSSEKEIYLMLSRQVLSLGKKKHPNYDYSKMEGELQ